MKVDLKPNEVVVRAGDSQHLNGKGKIAGKLILTNQRVYFKSPDQSEYNMEIMPTDIEEVIFFNTSAFSSNGLNIVTRGGDELKFKISQRNAWGKAINQMY
ncbi:MAG: GRAM domain-containing protein [Bacteroidota bacterium]